MDKNEVKPTPVVRGVPGDVVETLVVSHENRYPVDVSDFVYGSDVVDPGVKILQTALNDAGVDVEVDGVYGYATRQAIVAFQVSSGLGGMQANGDLLPSTLDLLFPSKG